jgi:hypothetical protein
MASSSSLVNKMNELSLHILDIVQNSLKVESTLIRILVDEDITNDELTIIIEDNGRGMDENTVLKVRNPFYTSRSTRKVGLGLSLLELACNLSHGSFKIESTLGKGTKVTAKFKHSHIDRAPLGNMRDTIYLIMINDENCDILYQHTYNGQEFKIDTREINEILGGVPLQTYDVMMWIKGYIDEGLLNIKE